MGKGGSGSEKGGYCQSERGSVNIGTPPVREIPAGRVSQIQAKLHRWAANHECRLNPTATTVESPVR